MSDAHGGGRRRHAHRSRSRRHSGHHHHRRKQHNDDAEKEAVSTQPAPPAGVWPPAGQPGSWVGGPPPENWQGGRESRPPDGWHGRTSGDVGGLPAAYIPPVPEPLDSRAVQLGAVEYRYEPLRGGVEVDPYIAPYGAVPPPPGLDESRGKGKGGGTDGLIVTKLPEELCTLSALNRHFRQFGEVLRITAQADECKAFVQFAERAAAEAALLVPVCDRRDIQICRAPRVSKGKSDKGKGCGVKGSGAKCDKGKGAGTKGSSAAVPHNRVLHGSAEDHKKFLQAWAKRDEISKRKAQLLGMYTDQLKSLMAKLQDGNLPEAKRVALKEMMKQIKERIDSFANETATPGAAATASRSEVGTPTKPRSSGKVAGAANASPGNFTLDLRPRTLRVSVPPGWTAERMRQELKKLDVGDADLQELVWQSGSGPALLRFRDRKVAQKLYARRTELPATLEWSELSDATPQRDAGDAEEGAASALLSIDAGDDIDEGSLQKNLAAALGAAAAGEEVEAVDEAAADVAAAPAAAPASNGDAVVEAPADGRGAAPPAAVAAAAAAPTPGVDSQHGVEEAVDFAVDLSAEEDPS